MSTILAIDDSATMRKCLEIAFEETEFELVTCDNAAEGIEQLASVAPALVIADVSLSPTDGYQLCNTIKQSSPALPVLMLSSKQTPFDATKGGQADDHLDKPFDTQALQDRARQLLAAAPQVVEAPVVAAVPAPAAPAAPVAVPPVERAAAAGKIPAPRRRRPTPAMMPNPLANPKPAAVVARRTVPFAMPSPLKKTTPGMSPAQAEAFRRGGPQHTMPMAGGIQQAAAAALGRAATTGPKPAAAAPPAASVEIESAHADDELPPPTPQSALPVEPAGAATPRVAAVTASAQALPEKLAALGLSREQLDGVMALSREVLEQVVWEVVPTLAETLIKEEIARLTRE